MSKSITPSRSSRLGMFLRLSMIAYDDVTPIHHPSRSSRLSGIFGRFYFLKR